jgi:hypothetical protein
LKSGQSGFKCWRNGRSGKEFQDIAIGHTTGAEVLTTLTIHCMKRVAELGGYPAVWAISDGNWCALMSKTPMRGTFVLGHDTIQVLVEKFGVFLKLLSAGESADRESDESHVILGLSDPLRALSWYPGATTEASVILDWSPGYDRTDGFLQLVGRKEIMEWPVLLGSLAVSPA